MPQIQTPEVKATRAARARVYRAANREKVSAVLCANRLKNKVSRAAKSVAYRVANKDKLRAKRAAYYLANRELLIAKAKARRQNNLGRYKARDKTRYWANKSEKAVTTRQWRKDNAEYCIRYRAAQYALNPDKTKKSVETWRLNNYQAKKVIQIRYLVKKRGALGKHTATDLTRIMKEQNNLCTYCSSNISKKFSIDHIEPLSRGGTNWPDNIQLVCHPCNSSKGARNDVEYRAYLSIKESLNAAR